MSDMSQIVGMLHFALIVFMGLILQRVVMRKVAIQAVGCPYMPVMGCSLWITGMTGYMCASVILRDISMFRLYMGEVSGLPYIWCGSMLCGELCIFAVYIKTPAMPRLNYSVCYIFRGIFIFIPGRRLEELRPL